jgi:hypothetical protein
VASCDALALRGVDARFVRYDDTIALATTNEKGLVDLIHGFQSIADVLQHKISW